MTACIYAVATLDTKGKELAFVADVIRRAGIAVKLIDVGTQSDPTTTADISRSEVASFHPKGAAYVLGQGDRGAAVAAMSESLIHCLMRHHQDGHIAGVIGLGGTGGTALISPALRALPIGLPKVLVSTVASGNTAPYVGSCDITLMPSVVDVAGINRVSHQILTNAANAISGMVLHRSTATSDKPAIGMTMFGVTTPCVTAVREALEADGSDVLVFHATGTGGQAMEKLVESRFINGVIDVTTTEVADEIVGGIFPAGPARFDMILERRVPYVVSLGALDMVNFGALDSVPSQFRSRTLQVHNPQITLLRTTPDENRQIARWMAAKLNRSSAPLIVLIPEGGVSALDAPGQPFWNPEADTALFEELESAIEQTPARQVRRLPFHINDPAFARALVSAYREVCSK